MLVLSRKSGERIVISDDIIIRVVEIKGDTVRLAIEAPRQIPVHRGEIYDAISQENQAAAMTIDLPSLELLFPASRLDKK